LIPGSWLLTLDSWLSCTEGNNPPFNLFDRCHNYYLKRIAILTFQVYGLLLSYNIAFSVLAAVIFIYDAGFGDAGNLFFAKIIGFLGAAALHYYYSRDSYFYFRNAGYRVRKILISAFAADMLIYMILATFYTLITHAATHAKG